MNDIYFSATRLTFYLKTNLFLYELGIILGVSTFLICILLMHCSQTQKPLTFAEQTFIRLLQITFNYTKSFIGKFHRVSSHTFFL